MPQSAKHSKAAQTAVMILAAGQGKRMRSELPKVLHELAGQPMIFHVLDGVLQASSSATVCIVVGHGRERVEAAIRGNPDYSSLDIHFVHQAEQRGTGHAARCAMDSSWGDEVVRKKLPVLVLPGDLPLIPAELIRQTAAALGRGSVMRILSTVLQEPAGYGRIVRRGKSGPVLRIVEEKDASLREKELREVGTSIYFFQSGFLKPGLGRLSDKNAQKEFYLTDLVSQASRAKRKIDVLIWPEPQDLRGVNDPWELSQAGRLLNQRIVRGWAKQGVKFTDPESTWVDSRVRFEGAAEVLPNVLLQGATHVGEGARIGPHAVLKNLRVGAGAVLKAGTVGEDSIIGARAQVGPYAHLRPGSDVGEDCKIGNFVELKKARLGRKTSVSHLSYLGDAEVGSRVNIGCGFITCNYDGKTKSLTVIEDDVFMGSDCQAVAPVKIGKGAYVASGSTLTEDVEPGALAIARSRQVNKPGYAKKYGKQE
jgi:bifunctional UDP-N-acetylglucosamine pyrophosphorylase/glucosamine-1-phosphate N-acetyltransferase